jgi:hypothetical protein
MSREEIWVLCRATGFNEIIVITKRDYDHWTSYLVTQYEFIAQGRRSEMERFQQLAKGR